MYTVPAKQKLHLGSQPFSLRKPQGSQPSFAGDTHYLFHVTISAQCTQGISMWCKNKMKLSGY